MTTPVRQIALTASLTVSVAQNQRATWYAGDDVLMTFTMSPVTNITGWTVMYTLLDAYGGTQEVQRACVITDGPNGVFTVTIASADTLALLAYDGRVWEARRFDYGTDTALASGTLNLLPAAILHTPPPPSGAVRFLLSPTTVTPTAGTAFPISVTALDANGNVVTNYAGTVHFTGSDGQAVLPADTTLTNGTGTFSITLKTAGVQTVTAADTVTPTITGAASATVAAATANKLIFGAQPTASVLSITTTTVFIEDVFGNLRTADSTAVTVALTVPGGATLGGTPTRNAANGVATFNDLTVDLPGTYTLTATASGLTSAVSNSFTPGAGVANKLAFVTQPSNAYGNIAISPAVSLQILDAGNNLVPTATNAVTITLTTPGGAVLTGGGPLNAVNGAVAFSNLVVDKGGTYTLTATSAGLTNAVSNSFVIDAATHLGFGTQPSTVNANSTISPAVTVRVLHADNTLDTTSTASVTIALTSAQGATLGGTLTRAAVAGVATFNDLTDNLPGTYSLTATASGLTDGVSSSFDVHGTGFSVRHVPGSTWTEGYGVAIQTLAGTDYILVSGTANIGAALDYPPLDGSQFRFCWCIARYFPGGQLDTSFGSEGYTIISFDDTTLAHDNEETSILVLASGKILCGGGRAAAGLGSSTPAMARLHADGTLDTTFGTNGRAYPLGIFDTEFGSGFTLIAEQSDGHLIFGFTNFSSSSAKFAVGQTTADGALVTAFGGRGTGRNDFLQYDPGTGALDSYFHCVYVDPSDDIFLTGGIYTDAGQTQEGWWTHKINGTDGVTNKAEWNSGVPVVQTFSQPTGNIAITGATLQFSVLRRPSGKIIVVGRSGYNGSGDRQVTAVQYNTDGSLDTGFGTGGIYQHDFHTVTGKPCTDVTGVLQADGKIVFTGYGVLRTEDTGVSQGGVLFNARLLADGSGLDTTYGGGLGYVLPLPPSPYATTTSNVTYYGGLDNSGRLICNGHVTDDAASPKRVIGVTSRYRADTGALDLTFGDPPGVSPPAAPTVTTGDATSITTTTATIPVTVSGNDGWIVVYGPTRDFGSRTAQFLTTGSVSVGLTGLAVGATYYYQAGAYKTTNGLTTVAYGATKTFDTTPTLNTPALKAYWTGAASSGTTPKLTDETANGHTLTNNNTVTSTAGGLSGGNGKAFTLVAASSQYLSIANHTDFQTGADTDWTWAFTLKATTVAAAQGLFVRLAANNNEYDINIGDVGAGSGITAILRTPNNSASVQTNSTVLTAGTNYRVVIQYSSATNLLYIWVNGSLVTTSTAIPAGYTEGTVALEIGRNQAFGGEYFGGQLSEIGFWKSAAGGGGLLSAAQVALDFNSGSGQTWPLP